MRRAIAILVAAPWIAWAAVRTAGFALPYPLAALVTFTPYAALTSPLPLGVALLLRRWTVAAVAAAALLAFAVVLLPRAVAGPRADADGPRLVVMTANVHVGDADPDALLRAAAANDVDVLSLQELRPALTARLDAAAGSSRRIGGPWENAIYTRLPARLIDTGPTAEGHEQPRVELTVAGAPPVRVKVVHPAPPVNRRRARDWSATLAALPGATGRGPVQILAGDFNATLDHHDFRAVLDRGYVDAADAAGDGLSWTWPAQRRRAPPVTIDHVLVDRRVRVERVRAIRIPRSDHRAVIAVLTLPKE